MNIKYPIYLEILNSFSNLFTKSFKKVTLPLFGVLLHLFSVNETMHLLKNIQSFNGVDSWWIISLHFHVLWLLQEYWILKVECNCFTVYIRGTWLTIIYSYCLHSSPRFFNQNLIVCILVKLLEWINSKATKPFVIWLANCKFFWHYSVILSGRNIGNFLQNWTGVLILGHAKDVVTASLIY